MDEVQTHRCVPTALPLAQGPHIQAHTDFHVVFQPDTQAQAVAGQGSGDISGGEGGASGGSRMEQAAGQPCSGP